jgi:hypothetical protein
LRHYGASAYEAASTDARPAAHDSAWRNVSMIAEGRIVFDDGARVDDGKSIRSRARIHHGMGHHH